MRVCVCVCLCVCVCIFLLTNRSKEIEKAKELVSGREIEKGGRGGANVRAAPGKGGSYVCFCVLVCV